MTYHALNYPGEHYHGVSYKLLVTLIILLGSSALVPVVVGLHILKQGDNLTRWDIRAMIFGSWMTSSTNLLVSVILMWRFRKAGIRDYVV